MLGKKLNHVSKRGHWSSNSYHIWTKVFEDVIGHGRLLSCSKHDHDGRNVSVGVRGPEVIFQSLHRFIHGIAKLSYTSHLVTYCSCKFAYHRVRINCTSPIMKMHHLNI